MSQRDVFLKEFREKTIGHVSSQSSLEEQFQNEILRPILKLQNDLIIISFKNYAIKNKIDFNSFSTEKKMKTIENAVHKDIKFQNVLKGIIIGLFTSDEFEQYSQNFSSINKRLTGMLTERLKSQLQLL